MLARFHAPLPLTATLPSDGETTRTLHIVAFRSVETNTRIFYRRKQQTTAFPRSSTKRF